MVWYLVEASASCDLLSTVAGNGSASLDCVYTLVCVEEMDTTNKPKVLIAILTQGWNRMELTLRVPMLVGNPAYECVLTGTNDKPMEHVRNKLALLTKQAGFDWLLMVDADNPPIRNPVDLLTFDKDVMFCPTPIFKLSQTPKGFRGDVYWSTFEPTGKPPPNSYKTLSIAPRRGLERIDDRGAVAGSGCLLIRREVFERLRAPFVIEWDDDGLKVKGSDVTFCEKATALGFEIWTHYDYPCLHWSEIELSTISNAGIIDPLSNAPPDL